MIVRVRAVSEYLPGSVCLPLQDRQEFSVKGHTRAIHHALNFEMPVREGKIFHNGNVIRIDLS